MGILWVRLGAGTLADFVEKWKPFLQRIRDVLLVNRGVIAITCTSRSERRLRKGTFEQLDGRGIGEIAETIAVTSFGGKVFVKDELAALAGRLLVLFRGSC